MGSAETVTERMFPKQLFVFFFFFPLQKKKNEVWGTSFAQERFFLAPLIKLAPTLLAFGVFGFPVTVLLTSQLSHW